LLGGDILGKKNPDRLADQAGVGSMTEENLNSLEKLFLLTMTVKMTKSFIQYTKYYV